MATASKQPAKGRGRASVAKQRQGGQGRRPQGYRSPSLPMLRTSERSTFKRCEFQWLLSYERELKPATDKPALRYGSLIHKGLADYYVPGIKRGENPVTAFERHYAADLKVASKMGWRDEDGKWADAGEMGVGMLTNYIDEYGKDDAWEVLVTEQPFKVLVHHPTCQLCFGGTKDALSATVVAGCPECSGKSNTPWFEYVGVLDGVWRKRSDKSLWIPDHKTTSGIGPATGTHLVLDDQAGAYWDFGVEWLYAKGFLKPNQKLKGMLYNYLRKAMPDERKSKLVKGKRVYLNIDGSVSAKQPSPYFLRKVVLRDEFERGNNRARALEDYRRVELARAGDWEISKNPGLFTCPMCPMLDVCELHEVGADYESMIKGSTQHWDPYAEHEIYAAETH